MRRAIGFVSVCLLLLATTPLTSLAQTSGAHFFSATGSVETNANNTLGAPVGALVVNFDEAGLGNISGEVAYSLSANATANYACINGGSNHPKAANKETVNGPVTAAGQFTPTKNGRVIAALFAAAPSAGDFSCPSGQTLVLASVSYTSIVLTDTTDNVSTAVANTSNTFFTF
jgi:hypothetical protein